MKADLARRPGFALYAQLRERLAELIERDGLQPGDALPSEPELQERFGVSRATVRHALSELERSGRIERHQGRGTFVAVPRLHRALPELTSFTEHLTEQGIRSASQLIRFDRLLPDERPRPRVSDDEPDPGACFPGEPVIRVIRLRLANETPIGIHTTLTPQAVAERIGLAEESLRADPRFSFYRSLEDHGLGPIWAEEHLVARGSNPVESRLLGTSRSTPVMSVLRLTRSMDDQLVEAVRAVYLGDKYDYVVHLERRPTSSGLTLARGGGARA